MIFWDQTLLGLFRKGGFAMWPLLLCSILGLAIMAERFYYFLRLRLDYGRFLQELKLHLGKGKIQQGIHYCQKYAVNPVALTALLYLKNLDRDSLRWEILKREGSLALEKLEARLRGLATITHLAPLLGLLGTVTGLVTAFHQIEIMGGQVQPGDLAAGIWEALITTVFGLVIAIPCMAAYHAFENSADRIARRMEFVISELDEFFGKKSLGKFKSQDVESTEEEMTTVQS
jgi:biopolymer transport protein ExbB